MLINSDVTHRKQQKN